MTRSLLSWGLFIFSIVITVWTIRDVLRAKREFAVAGP